MSIHRRYLAFSLAGAFFSTVCMLFAFVVLFGLVTARSSTYTAQRTHNINYDRAQAVVDDSPYGGRLVATIDGAEIDLPNLKTEFDVDVRGDLVTVAVTQRFENPGDVPLDATYLFPLHEDVAVYAMTMRIGDEVVRAVIQQEDTAKATFDQAVAEGKSAALTEQHRPNLFQQSVGNLMPGVPVEIELRYVHAAERRDGRYHLTLPTVVGPRYTPPGTTHDLLPPEPPESIDAERVSIAVRIDAGLPLADVASDTHAIDVMRLGPNDAKIRLDKWYAFDNRHFELNYGLVAATTQAGLLADFDPRVGRGYFSLLIEPPAAVADDSVTPREMVFVLDCSGSMHGQPMDASKAFMRRALRGLRPTDTFRIIEFSESASEYSTAPIAATPANIDDALTYVDDLDAESGTNMSNGVRQALKVPVAPGSIRLVTFLTDGYIGNEFEVVTLLREQIGEARLFAIGVGAGPNRFLLESMARTGRGFARYVDPTEDVDAVAAELAERLQTPVLTDIRLAATDAGFANISPAQIPDLFAGESVRVIGTYKVPGKHTVIVRGNVAGQPVEIPVVVDLPGERVDGDAVRLMWARAQIDDLMYTLMTPFDLRELQETDAGLEAEVTLLGLEHSLVTQWTSFVAVSDAVVNPDPSRNVVAPVPVAPVAGTFRGGATPEPGILGGLLLTAAAAASARRRRRSA